MEEHIDTLQEYAKTSYTVARMSPEDILVGLREQGATEEEAKAVLTQMLEAQIQSADRKARIFGRIAKYLIIGVAVTLLLTALAFILYFSLSRYERRDKDGMQILFAAIELGAAFFAFLIADLIMFSKSNTFKERSNSLKGFMAGKL